MKPALTLLWLLAAMASNLTNAQTAAPMAKVTAWGMHFGGELRYRYQVQNFGPRSLKSITIGLGESNDGWRYELSVRPNADPGTTSFWIPSSVAEWPVGWGVKYDHEDEGEHFGLQWIEANYKQFLWPLAPETPLSPKPQAIEAGIPALTTWTNFSVSLAKADAAYVEGHVIVNDGEKVETLRMVKGDTLPPTLELITHRVGNPGRHEGWEEFEIEARARDNYDPNPELRLEPVKVAKNGDIRIDYAQGKWHIRFKNHQGNSYQLRFSAEDASGNKASKTFDYVVGQPGNRHKISGHE